MTRLAEHKQALYELRFSPMCKPAGEVANLTQLESHTTRARTMMFWRIAEGYLEWGPREVELLYESTLDSISEAFDVYNYPVSQYMLDARADVWDGGLAPKAVKQLVKADKSVSPRPGIANETALVVAGEIAQIGENAPLFPLKAALNAVDIAANIWQISTGALAYTLGARDVARIQAEIVVSGIADSGVAIVIADSPQTAWALTGIYPALGLSLPDGVTVKLLSEVLVENGSPTSQELGTVLVHDSRAAYFLADETASHLAIMPGYVENEAEFGKGVVYDAPRKLVDLAGGERVFGAWTRALAKTSGADDGLCLTYPNLAHGLAAQRIQYAQKLGANSIVTDSPLAAETLKQAAGDSITVYWLPELVAVNEAAV